MKYNSLDPEKLISLKKLVEDRFKKADAFIAESKVPKLTGEIITEGSELPEFEGKKMPFGKFIETEYVALMTDIRSSTDIIKGPNGTRNMFFIFYAYSALVAKIIDDNKGTATEFLGDGVLNLFPSKENRDLALELSIVSAWQIMDAVETVLNPALILKGINPIQIGIGIAHGEVIVTQVGYKTDTDLKAYGPCLYEAASLSKGRNSIYVSQSTGAIWPRGEGGRLSLDLTRLPDGETAFLASNILQLHG